MRITPADAVAPEGTTECFQELLLAISLAVTMAAGIELVEPGVAAKALQLGSHLAGMAGVNAIVEP